MAVRHSNSVRMHHDENVTPEKRATPSPKSKKCLDLTLAASPNLRRGPPLNEANSLTAGWIQSHHATPRKENSKNTNFEEISSIETSSPSRPKASPLSVPVSPAVSIGSPLSVYTRSPLSVPASPAVSTRPPLSVPASPAMSTRSPLSVPASPAVPGSPDMFAATPSCPPSQWPLSTLSPCNIQTPRTVLSGAPVRRRSLLSNIRVNSSVSNRSRQKPESARPYLRVSNQPTPEEADKNAELAKAIKSIGKISFYKSKPRKSEDADTNKEEADRDSILDNNNKVEEKSESIETNGKKRPSLSLKNRKLKTPMESKNEVPPTKSSLEVMKEETSSLSRRSSMIPSLRRRSTSITRSKRATGGRRSIRGVKRKSHDGSLNSGVGHAIKKPRYNPKSKAELHSYQPTVKTKILSSIEHKVEGVKQILQHSGTVPFRTTSKETTQSNSSKQTPKEIPESSSSKPTVGQISMTRHTRVSYEMKGGKMVFRKTPKTPLRRSPRKKIDQSPNSKNYFSPKPGNMANHVRSTPKLFSPKQNYLHPEQTSSPIKSIPSPVKFNKSSEDEESMEVGSGTDTVGTIDDIQSTTFGQVSSLGDQQVGASSLGDQQLDASSLGDQQVDASSLGDASSYSLVNLPPSNYPMYATEEEVALNSTPLYYQPPETIEQLLEVMESTGQFGPAQGGPVDTPAHMFNTSLDATTDLEVADMLNSVNDTAAVETGVNGTAAVENGVNGTAGLENGVNGTAALETGMNGTAAAETGASTTPTQVFESSTDVGPQPVTSATRQPTTAALAVSSILANLSSSSASSGDGDSLPDVDQDSSSTSSKLFPIFYKSGGPRGSVNDTPASRGSVNDTPASRGCVNDTPAARGSVNDTPASVNDTPASASVASKRFVLSETDHTQRIIDAGQKVIGATLCLTCGTVYSVGDPQDELQHANIHSGMLEKLNFCGWKHERVVGEFACGRVIMVKPEDHKHMWNKVSEVLSIVDKDLGFSEVGIRAKHQTKSFLFVADRKVVGLLLAETVETGYRMLPTRTNGAKVYCCSQQPNNIICGISRIWVLADYRRKKIGSSLVDCFRSQFVYGHYLREDQFAFSDPTLNGIDFATKYMGNQEFLVYNR